MSAIRIVSPWYRNVSPSTTQLLPPAHPQIGKAMTADATGLDGRTISTAEEVDRHDGAGVKTPMPAPSAMMNVQRQTTAQAPRLIPPISRLKRWILRMLPPPEGYATGANNPFWNASALERFDDGPVPFQFGDGVVCARRVLRSGPGFEALKSRTIIKQHDPKQPTIFEDPMPDRVEPCLAKLVSKPPVGNQWAFEVKWDGYRLAVHIEPARLRILTRNGLDWTNRFPTIAQAATRLSVDSAIIDGEAVVLDNRGASDFGSKRKSAVSASGHPVEPSYFRPRRAFPRHPRPGDALSFANLLAVKRFRNVELHAESAGR